MSVRHHLRYCDHERAVGGLEVEDRYVAPVVKRNRNFTLGHIAANLATATGTHVSARTISQQLNQVGLYLRKNVRSTPLQPRHRRERFRWYKDGWDHQNWSRVMLSNESRFSATDLNPIEYAWDALGRRVAQRTIPPRTV
ncbi:hypothetical protein TNCV_4564811 [Trichonephila clavipes]|nr:hypothetical protein TNCV_4564811 [Trichonephila clavipes]